MLTQEYIQLVKDLQLDKLLEFAKRFFVSKYNGDVCSITNSDWPNTYILTVQRGEKTINRFFHISETTEQLASFIHNNIQSIADRSNETVYRKLECLCLYEAKDINDIVESADIDYGIRLDIYDLYNIGIEIEKSLSLKEFLISSPSKTTLQEIEFNSKNKILYELFTTGNKIADIKNCFISSYIQYYLLERGPLSTNELKTILQNPLPNLSSRAFSDAMRKSVNSQIIVLENGKYKLTDDYKAQLEEMRAVSEATEKRLLNQFEDCLKEYGIKDTSRKILNTILELYKTQSNNELVDFQHKDSSENAERELVRKLFSTLIDRGIERSSANTIVQRLLSIISDSEYLNKVSATTLFTGLFNSNSLEDYLGKQKRVVFFDTQILLQLLCVDYREVQYDDPLYEAGKILFNQLEESQDYVSLYTTLEYIREVSNHLFEAYNLRRFINLHYIRDFGPSKNVFYNYYLYLTENNINSYSCYEEYLEDFLNTDEYLPNGYYEFVEKADNLVVDILNGMGILIQPINPPANLNELRRDYDIILGDHPKGNKARENDVLCRYYLSDQTNFINAETGLSDEPYLITLDHTITDMRKKLVDSYHRSFWYVYPPLKFANRLSIMNLKLDSKKINYDIICMAETNFNASYESVSMLDIMTMFFKNEELDNKKLPRMLARMKSEERNNDHLRDYSERNNSNLPIDVVLNYIHKHYRNQSNPSLNDISKLFEIDEVSDNIYNLLKNNCDQLLKGNRLDESLFKELDNMVYQYVKSASDQN